MAFRYINPGYVSLLDSDCVATEITNSIYSKTGVAFTQTNSSAGVTIPNFKQGDDFWARFDAYIPSVAYNREIQCFAPNSMPNTSYRAGWSISIPSSDDNNCTIYCYYSGTYTSIKSSTIFALGIEKNAINTFIIHIKQAKVNTDPSLLECFVNGNFIASFTGGSGSTLYYSDNYPKNAKLNSNSTDIKFSNVIFSNEEISAKEQCIALPVYQTITDMTAGANGIYIADAANQSLLQSIDISSLIQDYGANSAITNIMLVGNPAYKTATGLANLTALSKVGNNITEHDTVALSSNSTAVIMDGWGLSGVSISDLQNMRLGWKVEE